MDLDEAFKSAFRTIFGECNVALGELKDYLSRYHYPIVKRKSSISGKEVALSMDRYCEGAKFLSQDEVDYGKCFSLDINAIKDVDSIMEAVRDRAFYAGNKVLGTSKFVEGSDTIVDSFHVRDSHNITESKYVAYSAYIRGGSEYVFGSSHSKTSKCAIHTYILMDCARCFETCFSDNSSDLFFCSNCQGCSHAMFSFNLRSKRHCIGNVELPKDKYFTLRKKLVEESREYLEKNKSFYSIFGFAGKPDLGKAKAVRSTPEPKGNLEPIESAFRSTSKIVLGKELGPLDDYGAYLNRGLEDVEKVKTVFGNTLYYSNVALCYKYAPRNRLNSTEEADELGKLAICLEGDENLQEMMGKLDKIAFYRGDHFEGENHNIMETHWAYNSANSYRMRAPSQSKNCAYSTMALASEAIFGSYRVIRCKFCMHCYDSIDLVRCFEVSDSSNCSDCHFCHNCENMSDCMFCFNTKSKRYAIGNVEVGRENYIRMKKMVLDEMVKRLEKGKTLGLSIYNLGCTGK